MPRSGKRLPYLPPKFPCGCFSGAAHSAWYTVVRMKDGRRVCRCGKVWKLIWIEGGQIS